MGEGLQLCLESERASCVLDTAWVNKENEHCSLDTGYVPGLMLALSLYSPLQSSR